MRGVQLFAKRFVLPTRGTQSTLECSVWGCILTAIHLHLQRSHITHLSQLFFAFGRSHSFRDREVATLNHFAQKLRLCRVSTNQSISRPIKLDEHFHGAKIRKHTTTLRLDPVWTSFRTNRSLNLNRVRKSIQRFCLVTESSLRLAGFSQRVRGNREHISFLRCSHRRLRKLQSFRVVALLAIGDREPAQSVGHVSLSPQRRVQRQSFMKILQREGWIFLSEVNGADAEQDMCTVEMVRSFLV